MINNKYYLPRGILFPVKGSSEAHIRPTMIERCVIIIFLDMKRPVIIIFGHKTICDHNFLGYKTMCEHNFFGHEFRKT